MKRTKVVIVGGVAAGATAAGKAGRTDPHAHIVVFEKGPYISFANCGLPYYISGEVKNRGNLIARRPEDFKNKYGIDVFVNHEVIRIDRPRKTILVRDLIENREFEEEYDKLILAMGGTTFLPPIAGIQAPNIFALRSIPDIDSIDNFITAYNPRKAVVLGAGYIGVESADVLRKRGLEVTVVEMVSQVLPPLDPDMAQIIEDRMKAEEVRVITGDGVDRIESDSSGLAEAVVLKSGNRIPADMMIASLGIRPNLRLARDAGLQTGKYALWVDESMRTSDPDIFSAGDMVEVKHIVTGSPTWSPLAGPANMQGRVAGANSVGGNVRYKGTLRTSIVMFGKIAAGKTGLSEKEAKEEGYDYGVSQIKASSHAGYMGNVHPLYLKIIYKKKTGKLLGAQAVGEEGADKRIDVLATAITAGMTVEDLEQLNLSYAPQFSHALDPINVVASIAGGD